LQLAHSQLKRRVLHKVAKCTMTSAGRQPDVGNGQSLVRVKALTSLRREEAEKAGNMEKHLTFALSLGLAHRAITPNGNCKGIQRVY